MVVVCSTAEVRRHLNSFVKDELFHGEDPPPELSRRYYPTDADIRNILYTSRIGDQKAPDDQINLEIKCKDWQELNPEDFIFYRVKIHGTFNEMELSEYIIISLSIFKFDFLAINSGVSRGRFKNQLSICLPIAMDEVLIIVIWSRNVLDGCHIPNLQVQCHYLLVLPLLRGRMLSSLE
jgi:hypothetical protein